MERTIEKDSYGISEFCERNSISRGLYYKRLKLGQMPKAICIGGRRLITREAAEKWRAGLTSDKGKDAR